MSGVPHTLQQQTLDTDKELSKLGGFPPIPHSQASVPWGTSTQAPSITGLMANHQYTLDLYNNYCESN